MRPFSSDPTASCLAVTCQPDLSVSPHSGAPRPSVSGALGACKKAGAWAQARTGLRCPVPRISELISEGQLPKAELCHLTSCWTRLPPHPGTVWESATTGNSFSSLGDVSWEAV